MQGCQPPNLAAYHNSLGNALAETGDTEKAIAEFQSAAKADPSGAGRYYFNAGAVMTNQASRSKTNQERNKFIEAANQEFDQAIAANPNDAAPYCEKGKNLLNKATLSKDGKMIAPDGTTQALNKCIELDPNSQHAQEAKQLLAALGESVSTTYKAKKK
jgi:tetratricopeptide (TPR) repeat protein